MKYRWVNLDSLKRKRNSENEERVNQPKERWGHSCCAVDKSLYIIGGFNGEYLGDIWRFNFTTFSYEQIIVAEEDTFFRSNHTSCFYPPKNSILIFGGGHFQARFNTIHSLNLDDNTLKELEGCSGEIPEPRTYHASAIIEEFMFVLGGETTFMDVNDCFVFHITNMCWHIPIVQGNLPFRRFMSLSQIKHKLYMIAGCVRDYVQFKDMYVIDCAPILKGEYKIMVSQVKTGGDGPSMRWGHTASVFNDKIYLFGGRSTKDFNDFYSFNPQKKKWKKLRPEGSIPSPRRRHCAGFIGSGLVIFGGFDGYFHNDLYYLDVKCYYNVKIPKSTITLDYFRLIDNQDFFDIQIQIGEQKIYAHKCCILYRCSVQEKKENEFLKKVEKAPYQALIRLDSDPNFSYLTYELFKSFLEWLYTGTFVQKVSLKKIQDVATLTKDIGLFDIALSIITFSKKVELYYQRSVTMQQMKHNLTNEKAMALLNQYSLQELFNFKCPPAESPEEVCCSKKEIKCPFTKLCDFYDVEFSVEGSLIKANKAILSVRSEFFHNMFLEQRFRESHSKIIPIQGIPQYYFTLILKFLYTGKLFLDIAYLKNPISLLKLLIIADYFRLSRLIEICSTNLQSCVNYNSIFDIYLVSIIYNAKQLEEYCSYFMASNQLLTPLLPCEFKAKVSPEIYEQTWVNIKEKYEEKYIEIRQRELNNKLPKLPPFKEELEEVRYLIPNCYKSMKVISEEKESQSETKKKYKFKDLPKSNPLKIKKKKKETFYSPHSVNSGDSDDKSQMVKTGILKDTKQMNMWHSSKVRNEMKEENLFSAKWSPDLKFISPDLNENGIYFSKESLENAPHQMNEMKRCYNELRLKQRNVSPFDNTDFNLKKEAAREGLKTKEDENQINNSKEDFSFEEANSSEEKEEISEEDLEESDMISSS